MSDDLRHIATEVFLSIPPAVRTGVFIDLFAPDGCWYHGVRYMVDYGDAMDCDEREGPAVTTGTPVVCTTIVKEDSIRFDARHLHGLSDLTERHLVVEKGRSWKLAE